MAVDSPVSNNKVAPTDRRTAHAPPAGAFWKKYSSHHEFPLSVSSSVFLHIIGFVLLGGFLLALFGLNQAKELDVGAARVAGGGGGNPSGIGNERGDNPLPTGEAMPDKPQEHVAKNVNPEKLEKPELKKPELELKSEGDRPIEANSADTESRLAGVKEKLRAAMAGPIAGKGKGGPGQGGGRGTGSGPGEGEGTGPGKGTMTQREKRQSRWHMIFSTYSGEDYADQLASLGAILAIPGPRGEYLTIHNLDRRHRPVQARPEDIQSLNRIGWFTYDPQSVIPLSKALGIRPPPDHIIAFFPEQLEKELLEKELRFSGGKREEDIKETTFKVVLRSGRYVPEVESQR